MKNPFFYFLFICFFSFSQQNDNNNILNIGNEKIEILDSLNDKLYRVRIFSPITSAMNKLDTIGYYGSEIGYGRFSKINENIKLNKEYKWVQNDLSGTKVSEGFYQNDLKDSLWIYFRSSIAGPVNDTLSIGKYKYGVKVGNWIFFHRNNVVKSEGNFSLDFQDFLNNSSMISYGKTKNNELGYMSLVNRGYDSKKDGEWKEYYDDGKLRAKGTYSSGIKNNDWKYFNKIGDTLPNDELHKEPK